MSNLEVDRLESEATVGTDTQKLGNLQLSSFCEHYPEVVSSNFHIPLSLSLSPHHMDPLHYSLSVGA